MHALSRTHGYLNAMPYPELAIVMKQLGHAARSVGCALLIVAGLRGRKTRHGRSATWLELIAHYGIALFIWSSTYDSDDSAVGRVPRVIAATIGLLGIGTALGACST